jgi:hypothetical protein
MTIRSATAIFLASDTQKPFFLLSVLSGSPFAV